MYFPILRGRQFELLALRECVKENVLSNQIIPIVEPVKVSSTYIKTIDSFIEAEKPIAVIRNPQVGSWSKDLKKGILACPKPSKLSYKSATKGLFSFLAHHIPHTICGISDAAIIMSG